MEQDTGIDLKETPEPKIILIDRLLFTIFQFFSLLFTIF